ncbi:MAG: tetratricopeptide repeat protein, partial [Elusimicrobiota bacterium]|nr:tetratricopeptide repeat protein [Elusimicrobiota bacterium]
MDFLAPAPRWRPSDDDWELIKRRSLEKAATLTIAGASRAAPEKILSSAVISFSTSKDEVGAPLFYREVTLPFSEAVKDPSRIRWRMGKVSLKGLPPIVLENMPVCGNCHSFSADGSVLGMDIDYANDKGSYAIAPTLEEMVLDKSRIITWSDYKKEDNELTFGLLSQVSPDGNHVVSTVKDRSVFVAVPGLAFSQLFFPVKGILAVYSRKDKTFKALPGADDREFVQSNPAWSPDGSQIVFARSRAHELKGVRNKKDALLTLKECAEFLEGGKKFLFDLYRIPFNDGKGGKPEPLEGASNNGMSNFFAKYSPDGKWIVFCRAKSFMLLQPDSELYIMPAQGGTARKMRCNTPLMNSWHSWSPNSRWLVFSSKANSPYTQLFLTHIDEEGRDTPPVLLADFTSPDRAANIPEFVAEKAGVIKKIRAAFLDARSFLRAGLEYAKAGDLDGEIAAYRKALELSPDSSEAHGSLGAALDKKGGREEALAHYNTALKLDPDNAKAHTNLGAVMGSLGNLDAALAHYNAALRLNPDNAGVHANLGFIMARQGNLEEAISHYKDSLKTEPDSAVVHYYLAGALGMQSQDEAATRYREALKARPDYKAGRAKRGSVPERKARLEEAVSHYRAAVKLEPGAVVMLTELATALETQGKLEEAVTRYREAVKLKPDSSILHYYLAG